MTPYTQMEPAPSISGRAALIACSEPTASITASSGPAEPRRQILQVRERAEHLARPERPGLAPLAGMAVYHAHVAEPQQRREAGEAQPHRPGTDDHHRPFAAQAEVVDGGVGTTRWISYTSAQPDASSASPSATIAAWSPASVLRQAAEAAPVGGVGGLQQQPAHHPGRSA